MKYYFHMTIEMKNPTGYDISQLKRYLLEEFKTMRSSRNSNKYYTDYNLNTATDEATKTVITFEIFNAEYVKILIQMERRLKYAAKTGYHKTISKIVCHHERMDQYEQSVL